MTILLFVLLGVMAVAAGTTLLAIRRAKDGFEDEGGFHPAELMTAPGTLKAQLLGNHAPAHSVGSAVAPEPVLAGTQELPSGFLEGRLTP